MDQAQKAVADCGAFQFRDMRIPRIGDGEVLDYSSAWEMYRNAHLGDREEYWEELTLPPDHIVTEGMSDSDSEEVGLHHFQRARIPRGVFGVEKGDSSCGDSR